MTLALAAVALSVSIVPSILIAVGREYGCRPVAWAFAALVVVVRGVPAPVGLVFVFFALPFAGLTLDPFTAVAGTLTVVQVAYLSEVIRGGLRAVGRGQLEAARTLGLGLGATLLHVVGPHLGDRDWLRRFFVLHRGRAGAPAAGHEPGEGQRGHPAEMSTAAH